MAPKGATAATTSDASTASRKLNCPPLEKPLTYTRLGSMGYFDCTNFNISRKNFTSSYSFLAGASNRVQVVVPPFGSGRFHPIFSNAISQRGRKYSVKFFFRCFFFPTRDVCKNFSPSPEVPCSINTTGTGELT